MSQLTLTFDDGAIESKRCTACGRTLLLSDYTKRQRSFDGLAAACRRCMSKRKAGYYQRDRPVVREQRMARYWADPDAARAAKRRDYDKNGERRLGLIKERLKADPDFHARTRAIAKRTRWKKMARLAGTTVDQLEAKIAYWGDRCWMCGDEWEHLDHVKPILDKKAREVDGGLNLLCNLRPACRRCNQAKNRYWPIVTTRRARVPVPIAKQMLKMIDPGKPFDVRAFAIMARRLSL